MKLARESGARRWFLLVLSFFLVLAYFLAPFSYGDKRVSIPQHSLEEDAIEGCLLVTHGIDKLLTDPAHYYDTAVLYPDRTQLRSTEPFLGFAILGLPLTILRLGDVDVFEVVRWMIVFTSLAYAYLLFRATGVGAALSVAGAVLCLSQPDLVNGTERVQVVSIPLILPVLYHGLMVWKASQPRLGHSIALFFFAALYPLCGVINATISVLAAVFVLPLLVKTLLAVRRSQHLTAGLLPLLLAAAFDALALAPWLLDRGDLKAYASDAFLQIKHWNPTRLPAGIEGIPGFVTGRVGPGVAAAVAMLLMIVAKRYVGRGMNRSAGRHGSTAPEAYLFLPPVLAACSCIGRPRWSGVQHAGSPRVGSPVQRGVLSDAPPILARPDPLVCGQRSAGHRSIRRDVERRAGCVLVLDVFRARVCQQSPPVGQPRLDRSARRPASAEVHQGIRPALGVWRALLFSVCHRPARPGSRLGRADRANGCSSHDCGCGNVPRVQEAGYRLF